MSRHVAPSRRGARTFLVAELAFAMAIGAVPGVLMTANADTTPAPAPARAAWSANKFVGNQATFDTGTGGWVTTTVGGRAAQDGTTAQSGSGSLSLTNVSAAAATLVAASGSSVGTWTAATPGTRWIGTASVRAGRTGRAVSSTIAFLDAQGRPVDQAQSQPMTDTLAWQQVPNAVAIAPPTTAYAMLVVTVVGAAAGETHYIDNATLQSAPGGTPRVVGPLHTVGNKIVDGNGRAIIFRGFNRSGLERSATDIPTSDEIAHAQSWGANFIRVHLGEQFWVPTTCYYDPTYPTQVDSAVNTITSRGMVALLSLSYNSMKSCDDFGERPMADAPNAITFWQQVAARYKNNPLVAFDLYNEPFSLTDDIWLNGGSVTYHGTTFQAAGMRPMYNAVRGTGASNLVFVSGNTWANWFPKTPLTGTNIVYAVHAYTCPRIPAPDCTNTKPYDPSQFFNAWLTPAQTYPVMVTEFGWPNPDDGLYIRNVVRYAEQHGWSWSLFTWGNKTFGPFNLLASAGEGKNYEPKPTGMAALAGFAGS